VVGVPPSEWVRILNGVVVVVVIIWLLNVFGILDSIRGIHVGR
jgi:hypothetical protein